MNELLPVEPQGAPGGYRKVVGWQAVREGYLEYLHDESRLAARRVEAIHFPETAEQVADELAQRTGFLRERISIQETGAVISSHAGPGIIGVFALPQPSSS